MQVDCFKRNWKSGVCTPKCPFHWECSRAYSKEILKKVRESERECRNLSLG